MKTNLNRSLRTTVGDLIVALMDAALEKCKDEQTACRVTSLILNRMVPVPVPARRACFGERAKRRSR